MPDETNVGTTGEPTVTPDVSAPPTGQPTEGATEAAREPEAVEAGAATEAPPTTSIPEKFKGKKPEEIAAAYVGVEEALGRQAEENRRLREFAEWTQGELERVRAEREMATRQPVAPVSPPAPLPEIDWTDPAKGVEQIADRKVQEKLNAFVGAIQEARKSEVRTKAASAWDEGTASIAKNQRLFEGIENEVRDIVFRTYDPLVQRGQDASEFYRNPKVWESAAAMIRFNRGEYDRLIPTPAPTKGMTATATETPGSTRPSNVGSTVVLDERTRAMARELGITEAQAREYIELGKGTRR